MAIIPWPSEHRTARQHALQQKDDVDGRVAFARDRDRILYCSHFRRLAGVTQVVRTGDSDVFHNRLTHSMKVAQIGRRLAERVIREQTALAEKLGVHPEVVEAAGLAHDLGHPPFGHRGEMTLHEKVVSAHDPDGFEGNAQSFRILSKLALRFTLEDGLNLTRATLAATLKYPWLRDPNHLKKRGKWSVYSTERAAFDFARRDFPSGDEQKTAEAELMDWSDDIAYSVHDLEDFHRCRLVPWQILLSDKSEREAIVRGALEAWKEPSRPANADARLRAAITSVCGFAALLGEQPYEGTREQRVQLREFTSNLIRRYVNAIRLREPADATSPCVDIGQEEEVEVRVLKQITRHYVIQNPALAAQQRGQRRIIEELFDDLLEDAQEASGPKFLPPRFRYLTKDRGEKPVRVVADCIASLSEAEAVALHGRLRGHDGGSVLDPIVR